MIIWKKTEYVIKQFMDENKEKNYKTLPSEIMIINPQNIISINENYSYPEILNDCKMDRLKKSVEEYGWKNENIHSFELLMLPDGALLVNGAGNHRAVLAKELHIESVKALVSKVYLQKSL